MWAIISGINATVLQWVWWLLFVLSFAWIALAACSALAGLLRERSDDVPVDNDHSRAARGRVALLMPVYNEDPANTCAALQTMAEALIRCGQGERFELFVISDTRDPQVLAREMVAFGLLRDAVGAEMSVWYRRRHVNRDRKAGNVQDFVERWGGRYEYMVVLDADSLMDAETFATLVRRMDTQPRLGLLQTVPRLHGGHSLFARLQQFAGFLYGPVIARGVAAWQGRSGNYWGHNAIIRVAPFASSCGLPTLEGSPPFGGSILSHDFVEAALLRRAGWRVEMDPALTGSWEESPPTLLDIAMRDRRWAQGNLQHGKVVGAHGLVWTNRAHMLIGIMSYFASPLWLALITLGLIIAGQVFIASPEYFSQPFQLFPSWPQFDSERMIRLFVFSMAILLLPKMIGMVQGISHDSLRRGGGGTGRLLASSVFELLLTALYAPILMMLQTRQIIEILCGRDAGWNTQQRRADGIDWRLVWARHWLHATIGIGVSAALWVTEPILLAWLSPTLIGLVFAPLLSAVSGSTGLGRGLRSWRLLMIPEETEPPRLHKEYSQNRERYQAELNGDPIDALLDDEEIRSRYIDLLGPPPAQVRGKPDVVRFSAESKLCDAHDRCEALGWLTPDELVVVLNDRSLLIRLAALQNTS